MFTDESRGTSYPSNKALIMPCRGEISKRIYCAFAVTERKENRALREKSRERKQNAFPLRFGQKSHPYEKTLPRNSKDFVRMLDNPATLLLYLLHSTLQKFVPRRNAYVLCNRFHNACCIGSV